MTRRTTMDGTTARGVAALAAALALGACDFEVTNPGPVQDEFLDAKSAFVAQVNEIDLATARQRSTDLLEIMDLTTTGTTLVTDFSHGMRKKLSLAAALLPAPRLLFLDEPFEGIDAVASRQIKDLLMSFVARGGTIFLTSHILEIVERLSTHIGVIANGKIVAQGRIEELRAGGGDGTSLEELFIGLVGGDAKTHAGLDWI